MHWEIIIQYEGKAVGARSKWLSVNTVAEQGVADDTNPRNRAGNPLYLVITPL